MESNESLEYFDDMLWVSGWRCGLGIFGWEILILG